MVGEGPGFFAWFGDERVVYCRVVGCEDADGDGDGVASESVPLFPVGSSGIATSSVGFPAAFFLDEECRGDGDADGVLALRPPPSRPSRRVGVVWFIGGWCRC